MNFTHFYSYGGRHKLSLWASKIFEKSGIKKLFGVNLVAAVVFAGVVTPQADNMLSQLAIENHTTKTPIAAEIMTKSTYEMPLTDFKISQLFSFWHPGIDMTAPEGMPIYAIEAGEITESGNAFFGYGNHVIISHEHGVSSLYAHLSRFNNTFVGKKVDRGELIGYVGATGWATGNHLHLEVHINNVAINPLDVLPIKTEDIKYDGIMYQPRPPVISASPLSISSPQNKSR